MKTRLSDAVRGFDGPNPFHDTQAKTAISNKITTEFFPLPLYWSSFNEMHEILLGTRGSGKTIILRMMSYSCLRKFDNERARQIVSDKTFIGFYVPLHLEFMSSLKGKDLPPSSKLEYFQFAFNCLACTAYVQEISVLMEDLIQDTAERLMAEAKLSADLYELWFGDCATRNIFTLSDLRFEIAKLWEKTPFWPDGTDGGTGPFARPVLDPILKSTSRVAMHLKLDETATTWIACIDEAEFLQPEYWRCLNDFIRSEKRPLVVKIATMPFRHDTRDCLEQGVRIEPGNDYRYQLVDTACDSEDFQKLCDHILSARLKRCNLVGELKALEEYVGTVGNDDGYDYFMEEMRREFPTKEDLLAAIVAALSESRQLKFNQIKHDAKRIEHWYWKRFRPVYYLRALKAEDQKGNRQVGWFAGSDCIRKVADGNPRRFLEIMGEFFDLARTVELTPKNQHRLLCEYAERHFLSAAALGFVLYELLQEIGTLLSDRVHGPVMVDGGCHFRLDESATSNRLISDAVRLGVAYSFIFCDIDTLRNGFSPESDFRLAFMCAVRFWLPMRSGDPVSIRTARLQHLFGEEIGLRHPVPRRKAQELVESLQLELVEGSSNEP